MILFLLKSRVHKKHREWILSKLGELENGVTMIADFTSHEEFISKFLYYSHKYVTASVNSNDVGFHKASSLENFNQLHNSSEGVHKSYSLTDISNFTSTAPNYPTTQDLAFSLEEQEYVVLVPIYIIYLTFTDLAEHF